MNRIAAIQPLYIDGKFENKKLNPDAKIVICPSDHIIVDEKLFTEDVELALEHADEKTLSPLEYDLIFLPQDLAMWRLIKIKKIPN